MSKILTNVVTRLADRSVETLQHLSGRGSAWPEASSAAIRDLLSRMTPRSTEEAGTDNTDTSAADDMFTAMPSEVERLSHEQSPRKHNDSPDQARCHVTNNASQNTGIWLRPYADHFGAAASTTTNDMTYDASALTGLENSWDAFMGAGDPGFGILGDRNSLDPFSGFDIPFWFEQDQLWDFPQ
jgi:hypothetical protein